MREPPWTSAATTPCPTSGRLQSAWTGTPSMSAMLSTTRALRVTFSRLWLPPMVAMPASSIAGFSAARRIATASSWPGSQSRMILRGRSGVRQGDDELGDAHRDGTSGLRARLPRLFRGEEDLGDVTTEIRRYGCDDVGVVRQTLRMVDIIEDVVAEPAARAGGVRARRRQAQRLTPPTR